MKLQIEMHFSLFSKPQMSIEKLQKIATATVEPKYKARWLQWWNSSTTVRGGNKFPLSDVKETVLDAWLIKAAFWA